MASLFPPEFFGNKPATNGSSSSSSTSQNLVEFRAGKMYIEGRMCKPDPRKGLIYVKLGDEDQLIHFCWKDRTNGSIEEDLILFPEEAEFKKLTSSRGRIYILQFKSSSRRLFYWMQEPKEDKDDEYCQKVNLVINGQTSQHDTVNFDGGPSTWNSSTLEMLGGQLGLSELDLQSYWEQLRNHESEDQTTGTQEEGDISTSSIEDLSDLVTVETIRLLVGLNELESRYLSFIGGSSKSSDEWQSVLESSEFLNALRRLDTDLRHQRLNEILSSHNLSLSIGSKDGGLRALLQALQQRPDKNSSECSEQQMHEG